ncbi:hypothetical protein RB195_005724 [Necator americanus]|uniref:Uncharacterized protein n=1 Tax=Necator americanus TaxID=51031 RepID=A0ABR1BSE5_NECAM
MVEWTVLSKHSEQQWPEDKNKDTSPQSNTVNYVIDSDTKPSKEEITIIEATKFSTWRNLLRVIITILTFIFNVESTSRRKHDLKSNYVKMATVSLFRQAQAHNPISEDQKRSRANVDEEAQLWRSGGRTSNSTLSSDANNPSYLGRNG